MSASRDWVRMEAEIAVLLPEAGGRSAREQLLASLDDYSAAAIREARVLGAITPSADDCTRALEWLLRPVFICGHHRSGTTLLQSLLDGHPQLLALPSEGTYFTSFAHVARTTPSQTALESFAAEWIRRFVDPNFAPHFRLGRSDMERNPAVDFARLLFGWHGALRSRVPPKLAALLALAAAFWATTAPAAAPLLWVEKTPQNERYASRFAPLVGARFIQLVRDPRSTFASLQEIHRANGIQDFDAAEHARAIGRSLRLAVENRNRLGHRYLVVRYEELVERTEREVERVRQFLGIAPDPVLLLPDGERQCGACQFFVWPERGRRHRAAPAPRIAGTRGLGFARCVHRERRAPVRLPNSGSGADRASWNARAALAAVCSAIGTCRVARAHASASVATCR